MGVLHLAGMLEYSEPLRAQIEKYLLKMYAAVFIKNLEITIKKSAKRLAGLKAVCSELERLAFQVQDGDPSAVMELIRSMTDMAQAGILERFRVRPDEMRRLQREGDVQQLKRHTDRVRRMTKELRQESQEQLGNQAKAIKADLEKWKKHYDPKFDILRQGGPAPDLEIELKDEQFPFLGDKFRRHVKKLRGDKADIFDNIKDIKVVVSKIPGGAVGAWAPREKILIVSPPAFQPYDKVKDELDHVLTHELRHMTQSVMAEALGVSHISFDKEGKPNLFYQPGPGMAPRKLLNPNLTQALMRAQDHPEAQELIEKAVARGMRPVNVYNLDDLEFYTHLGDTVRDFRKIVKKASWTPDQRKLAADIFLGKVQLPDSREKLEPWIQKHDPMLSVISRVQRQHEFLSQMQEFSTDKFKKAVKEFSKVTEAERGATPQPEGLEKLWEMFLEERYDGGKGKVRNPNVDTRDTHPDISVHYLMRQDAPAYRADRRRIRQEFAGWRARRQRPATPPGGASQGIFAPPTLT